ncbi:MAG TPA: hypothetical protein VFJ77_02510 [Gaiellaceae bacterium]|nr:hypothetical protein [Gaiellaceae bacterium]
MAGCGGTRGHAFRDEGIGLTVRYPGSWGTTGSSTTPLVGPD